MWWQHLLQSIAWGAGFGLGWSIMDDIRARLTRRVE